MRILHIDCGERMQGGQWQVLFLLRGLRQRGHEQVLLATGELARRAREEHFDVRVPGCYPPVDVIHAHDAHAHTLAALRPERPLAVSRRVGFPVKRGALSRWKYGRATHFIAISRFVAATLVEAGLKPDRISVVYDGVPVPARADWSPNGRVYGILPVYGILKDPLAPLLIEAGRQAGVEIRGVDHLEENMRTASGLAYITNMQGLGSAALVAMAAGVPVIASRVGGLPEVVDHDRTGLLVENSVDSIAGALKRITTDDVLALRLSHAGRTEARSRFAVDTMIEETSRIYERLVG